MTMPAVVTEHFGIRVVRDDLLEGGSKVRLLPILAAGAKEIVYGSPFCGGAAWAMSVYGKQTGLPVTLFYAKRKDLHPRQLAAKANGAKIIEVPYGYMTNVQAKARAYAEANGARLLPLGFDTPAAVAAFVGVLAPVAAQVGPVDQVWCATGSGMLAKCLGLAFPKAEVHGVVVGLASRNEAQDFSPNVRLHPSPYKFEQPCHLPAPFPSDPNYDRKAWGLCRSQSKGRVLFWNVTGPAPSPK